ncbi:hypothetical protein BCR34DRAFT_653397 [Clohesyomyces aquaticus]|uniref:Uncharacterized protein n=1 Tax=Clohesyomyces aquaticus TaxID=1231657 RepID=A0A1Y1ZLH2_9PLEO|nr:hypothetical protein BCR34DRAFT_653397 [Clohesyomyces aquaticus]
MSHSHSDPWFGVQPAQRPPHDRARRRKFRSQHQRLPPFPLVETGGGLSTRAVPQSPTPTCTGCWYPRSRQGLAFLEDVVAAPVALIKFRSCDVGLATVRHGRPSLTCRFVKGHQAPPFAASPMVSFARGFADGQPASLQRVFCLSDSGLCHDGCQLSARRLPCARRARAWTVLLRSGLIEWIRRPPAEWLSSRASSAARCSLSLNPPAGVLDGALPCLVLQLEQRSSGFAEPISRWRPSPLFHLRSFPAPNTGRAGVRFVMGVRQGPSSYATPTTPLSCSQKKQTPTARQAVTSALRSEAQSLAR